MNENPKKLPNYYQILDLSPNVSQNEIFHAYSRAKRTYTSNSLASYSLIDDDSSQQILDEIETAYRILGNPAKRKEYDVTMGFNSWGTNEENAEGYTGDDRAPVSGLESRSAATPSSIEESHYEELNPPDQQTEAAGLSDTLKAAKQIAAQVHRENVVEAAIAPTAKTVLPFPSATELSAETYEANSEFEKQIASCTQVDGAFLKAVRIYRRLSPHQLAARCKIAQSHVIAIEEEDGDNMHEAVYLRGHVQLICFDLGIPNSHALAKTFVDRMKSLGKLKKGSFR